MISEPRFWRERTLQARLLAMGLAPLSLIYDHAQRAKQAASRGFAAQTPVFCAGAATLGGAGKTPFALLLASRLKALGQQPWFLTRGYGGSLRGPRLANPSVHSAGQIGDEALLLAASCPTIVARKRDVGARLAAGVDALVLDDGHQNLSLRKDCAFLVVDGIDPFGNGRVFPAGPLREPFGRALSRADAVAIVGEDRASLEHALRGFKGPVFRARLELDNAPRRARVTAFAGVGSPSRFFDLLERSGFEVVSRHSFPDHHPYTADNLDELRRAAAREDAALITTSKDYVRLAPAQRRDVLQLPVVMRVDAEDRLDALLVQTLDAFDARERRAP
jgi:tetraacyldisaccharide 4'-kinase